ncbi:MAG: hypothetical protein ACKVQS_14405 [Fimbriimonadaceae bacterium]
MFLTALATISVVTSNTPKDWVSPLFEKSRAVTEMALGKPITKWNEGNYAQATYEIEKYGPIKVTYINNKTVALDITFKSTPKYWTNALTELGISTKKVTAKRGFTQDVGFWYELKGVKQLPKTWAVVFHNAQVVQRQTGDINSPASIIFTAPNTANN